MRLIKLLNSRIPQTRRFKIKTWPRLESDILTNFYCQVFSMKKLKHCCVATIEWNQSKSFQWLDHISNFHSHSFYCDGRLASTWLLASFFPQSLPKNTLIKLILMENHFMTPPMPPVGVITHQLGTLILKDTLIQYHSCPPNSH